MVEKILSRVLGAVGLGAVVFGMPSAMAEETSVTLLQGTAASGESLIVVHYSDPEGEVGNGTYPPKRVANGNDTEFDEDIDVPMEINNFPEGEITNGMNPPL